MTPALSPSVYLVLVRTAQSKALLGNNLLQIQNASTPLATMNKAMNEGHGCATKAFITNQTDTTRKSHSVKG